MKKTTKKLLTFALATLFVGAGFGAVAAYNNSDVSVKATAEDSAKIDLGETLRMGNWNYTGEFSGLYMYRFWLDSNFTWDRLGLTTGSTYENTLMQAIKVNGKTLTEWKNDYKEGKTNPITWEGEITDPNDPNYKNMEANNIGYKKGMLDRIFVLDHNGEDYAPIDVTLCNHGATVGCTIDMYIPISMIPNVATIEFTTDFEYQGYTFAENLTFYGTSFGYLCKGEKAYNPSEIVETSITKAYHTDSNGGALYFYLSENDYPDSVGDYVLTAQVPELKEFLKCINYYDYIEIDGVKLGTLMGTWQGETFINVWNRKGTYSTRWPESMTEDKRAEVKEIKILAGCQFPAYENTLNKVFEVKEDITLVRTTGGDFVNTDYFLTAEDVAIKEAVTYGNEGELYQIDISVDAWNIVEEGSVDRYVFNRDAYIALRKNILINGVSIYDINANTDDSAYNYATFPWTHEQTDVFQHPVLVVGLDKTLSVYVHKQYIADAKSIEITLLKGFNNIVNDAYVTEEDIKATVWVKPVTLKVITGNQRLDPSCVATYEYAPGSVIESLEAPTAVGKTFAGWVDVNSEAVTFPLTLDESTAIYASWNVESYTVTIKQDGQEDQSFTFGVETVEGIDCPVESVAFALNSYLPANNEDYTYAWAEEVPATFELKDYTFTVVATEVPKYIEVSLNLGDNEIAIPAGKYATSYVYAMGDYVVNWTGDAIVTLGGMPVENGAKVTLANPMLNMNGVVITPVDATVDCTVVMTIAEYKAPVVELILGENAVKVTVEGNFCAGTEVEFTAAKAGTYVLKVVDGEENADFTLIEENEATWIEVLPYEFELAEGETIKFLVCTTAIMTLTEDEINFVIEEKADEPIIPDSSEEESSEESSEDVSSEEESSDDVTSEESSEDVSKPESSEEASDSASASESESSDSLLAGCFGSVSGLGVAALGLAAVVLFKKKED